MDDLSNALEEYWGKWELVHKENAEFLMRVDLALQQKGSPSSGADSNIGGSDTGASNDPFIRFNPPIDAKPAFLERESLMLEVLNFIESITFYILSGFRNNPPSTGSYIHLLPLINATWWQSLEAAGIREKFLPEIMLLIKGEAESRNPLHARRIQL